MSLKTDTKAAIDGLGIVVGSRTIIVQHPDGQLTCELSALDAVGCSVDHLTLSAASLAGAVPDRLRAISQDLAKRLTYLLEPISPIEFDADACHVQMRSSPPAKDEDGTTYYELLVRRGGAISLQRYQKLPGQPRTTIPAHFTRQVLLRLVDDFAAALV